MKGSKQIRWAALSAWTLAGVVLTAAPRVHASDSGKDERTCNIAVLAYSKGRATESCDLRAIKAVAHSGVVFEQNQMGIASVLGIAGGRDAKGALKWFQDAARRGYAPAQVNLAAMYSNGWGTDRNYGATLYWLRKAADQNYAPAYYDLGRLYLKGSGVRRDYEEALRLFRKAAEGGDTWAETNVGYMYDQGLGVAQDRTEAATWYRKAAGEGNALAQNNLADLYLKGEGVAQSDASAFQWFQKAAEQGQSGACIKLGYMYANGRGTVRDFQVAYTWTLAGVEAGDERGRDYLAGLESQLSPSQLAHAREQARKLNVGAHASTASMAFLQ